MAERSKAWVCSLPPAGIAGSNPAGGMDVCVLWVLCVVREKSLRRADHSSRGVLLNVSCHCVWSRNLKNEEAKTRKWIVKGSRRRRRVFLVSRMCLMSSPSNPLVHCFSNFLCGGTPKIIFYMPRSPCLENEYIYKEAFVSAWKSLQWFQLPEKTSCDISRYIYNFSAVFQNTYVFIPLFLSEPLTMFCGTLFEKHCCSDLRWEVCRQYSPLL